MSLAPRTERILSTLRDRQQSLQKEISLFSLLALIVPTGSLTCGEIRNMRLDPVVDHLPLAVLVYTKEDDGSRKGAAQGREPSAIQSFPDALLS